MWFKNKKLEERINLIQDQFEALKMRVWALEHPPKFKVGDKIESNVENDSNWYEVFDNDKTVKKNDYFHTDGYYRHILLRKVGTYEIFIGEEQNYDISENK